MRITPRKLASFAYCPSLFWSKKTLTPELTEIEDLTRLSILAAERKSMEKGSSVIPVKIAGEWEKLWWPKAIADGLETKEIEKISFNVISKLHKYCKYDIGSSEYVTVSTDVQSEVLYNDMILAVSADLVKISSENVQNELTIIDFSRKNITSLGLSTDIEALATASAFSGFKKTIQYITVDLSEDKKDLAISSCSFDLDVLRAAERMIDYLSLGISKTINFKSRDCRTCNLCLN